MGEGGLVPPPEGHDLERQHAEDQDAEVGGVRLSTGLERIRTVATVSLGALIWSVPFLVRLLRVPEDWWIARDDGIITLSHARNLADHGSIGVSPGGDRVEGFSSPLHFAVGTLIEVFGNPSARAATMGIFAVSLALTGAALAYGLLGFWSRRTDGPVLVRTLVTVGVVAAVMAVPWTTTGWLASGMENPLILLAGVLAVSGVLAGAHRRAPATMLFVGSTLLLVARVEFAALCVPVLAVAVLAVEPRRNRPTWRAVFLFGLLPLALAATVHLARRWYFGVWLPNTAVVQSRDAGSEQLAVIAAVALVFLAIVVRTRARSAIADPATSSAVSLGCAVVAVTGGVGLLWLEATGRTGQDVSSVLIVPGVLEFGALVAIAFAVSLAVGGRAHRDGIDGAVHGMLAALVLVPLTQYVVTGPARLDDNRISGLAVPFLVLWAAVATIDAGRAARRRRQVSTRPIGLAVAVLAGVALLATVSTVRADPARRLNYEIATAEQTAASAERFRDEHFDGIGLTITANPDLGKLSFAKHSLMVDLGWLGDPLLAELRVTRPELMDAYLGRIAVPDLVTTHEGWSCEYRGWLESPDFVEAYELEGDPGAAWTRGPETCPYDGRRAVWVRVVDEGEFALVRTLASAEDPAEVVATALAACRADGGDALRCQPVRRAVQRVAPHLRNAGTFDEVVARFDSSPSAALDRALLRRGPAWWEPATREVIRLLDGSTT